MTYEEAKEKISDMCCWGIDDECIYYEDGKSGECSECEFHIAIEALEKQIEYRWHNLLDDPKDLPCDTDSILVEIKNGDGYSYDTGYYVDDTKYPRFSLKCTSPNANIIRWKKIDK